MPGWLLFPGLLVISYLIGSIPFGILAGRYLKGIDIRKMGSGNIGAANAFRALGLWGGLLVLGGDVFKGIICAHMGSLFVPASVVPVMVVSCGIAGILGHNFSIFLGGKGGKGIAASTTEGVATKGYLRHACVMGLRWVNNFLPVSTDGPRNCGPLRLKNGLERRQNHEYHA